MNAHPPTDLVRWTPRRWFYAIGAVFIAQAGLIFFLAEQPLKPSQPPRFPAAIRLAGDTPMEQEFAEFPGLGDPTLLALPNLRGFSGEAWLIFPPWEDRFTDWTNSAQWLDLEAARLGRPFEAFFITNRPTPLLMANEPLPALPSPRPRLTNETSLARSEVRIEGDLARRRWLNAVPIPPWPYLNILSNTVVQLLVDAAGDALPPVLLISCGHSPADQFALQRAADARFEALRNGDLIPANTPAITSGKMIFKWQTVRPAITNTLSGGPSP